MLFLKKFVKNTYPLSFLIVVKVVDDLVDLSA